MGVSLDTYRAAIGSFNNKWLLILSVLHLNSLLNLCVLFILIINLLILILLSGTVHPNPGPSEYYMSVAHLNARSLNISDKFSEISAIAFLHKFDLFAFSETWLNSNTLDDSILIPGYNTPLRKDRMTSRGGGVALYVANYLQAIRRFDFESASMECLWAEIAVNRFKFLCGVCYRPPNQSAEELAEFLRGLQDSLDLICSSSQFSAVFILGDFNAHYNYKETTSSNTDVGVILYNFLECNNLSQLIEEPTRVSLHGETILDLIVTDSPGFFISSGTLSPPANCDHNIVFAKLHISTRKTKAYKRSVRNYNNVDATGFNAALNLVNWDSAFIGHNETIDCIYDKWINLFKSVVDVYIPVKHVTIRSKDKPWMNGSIRRAIRRRDRLLSVYSKHKNIIRWDRYRIQRNFVVSLIRQAKSDYFSKVNSELGNPAISSKKWWKLSKSLLSNKFYSPVPDLIVNGNTISEPRDKAEAFNQFFISQSCLVNADHAVVPLLNVSIDTLTTLVIEEFEVFNILNNLDVSKACGFDNISNKLLKLCAATIFKPFTRLINTSLSLGQYPICWKMANVIPLFKKNNRQLRNNYRPISLLVSLSKICEKVVFVRLHNFLNNTGFFYRFQSGFRSGDSTVMQLTYIVDKIYKALEKGREVRAVFLDISKAFDRVWHRGLLAKLKSLGVNGPMLLWFESYLSGRKQRVVIDGECSDWQNIQAGVPQGSVLGPLLFLIYINDITNDISTNCFLFADDSLLIDEVESPAVSARKLNRDLSLISTWAARWLVTMNAEKTESMIFSAKKVKPLHPPLYLSNVQINEIFHHEHLGVTLTFNLSWRSHILKIHQKASKRLNMLKPMRLTLARKTLDTLYKSLVRSCLEYADVVWDGCNETDSDLLEQLQYEAARLVTGAIKGTSRERLLNEVAWVKLKERRTYHKLNMIYKILNNLAPSYLQELCPVQVRSIAAYNLRTGEDYLIPHARTERFKKSFSVSSIRLWNNLPLDVRNSNSLVCFQNSYEKWRKKPKINPLFTTGNRMASLLHTRFRLGNSTLNYPLFLKNCVASPMCSCGIVNETEFHFFFECNRFAAERCVLLAAAEQLLGTLWLNSSSSMRLQWFLYGHPDVTYSINVKLFSLVQDFISNSKRFC